MKIPSREELAQSGTLEELYGKLGQIGIAPGWAKKVASLWPEPKKNFVPAHDVVERPLHEINIEGALKTKAHGQVPRRIPGFQTVEMPESLLAERCRKQEGFSLCSILRDARRR